MRNSAVQPASSLTALGEWVASRIPHIDTGSFGDFWWRWRLYGFAPLYRRCLIDITTYKGCGTVRVLGVRIFRFRMQQ